MTYFFEAWVLYWVFCSPTSRYMSQISRTVWCCTVLPAGLGDPGLTLSGRCNGRSPALQPPPWFLLPGGCMLWACSSAECRNTVILHAGGRRKGEELCRRREGGEWRSLLLGVKLPEFELAGFSQQNLQEIRVGLELQRSGIIIFVSKVL